MTAPITISSMFDGRSHHGAFRLHLSHRWKWWLRVRAFVCLALLIMGILFVIKFSGGGNKYADFSAVAFILLGSVGFVRPMIWQMFAERRYRMHPAFNSKIQYTFSNTGVNMTGKAGDVDVPWSSFLELVDTSKGLLMYTNKKEYIWIPSSDFNPGEIAQVCQLYHNK